MVRCITITLAAWLFLPILGAEAQTFLTVHASGLNVKPENSSSYIEVTARDANDAQLYQKYCLPNQGCNLTPPDGAPTPSSSYSRLVYDGTREVLTSCNGVPVTHEGASCEGPGVVKATTEVRLGKLKISAKAAAGYSGLTLSTSSSGVRLEFVDSAEDAWWFSYSNTNFGADSAYKTVPAGNYRVFADDLPAHCDPTQTDAGFSFNVPEYSATADNRLELIVYFRANDCQVTVSRSTSSGATAGTVTSTPEGVSCPDGSGPCTGMFAFGTQITLKPTGTYNWSVGNGCQPTNAACVHTLKSDRPFSVTFSPTPDPVPDAGVEPDAAVPTDDSAGDDSIGDDGEPDAAVSDGAGDDEAPADDSSNDGAEGDVAGDQSAGDGAVSDDTSADETAASDAQDDAEVTPELDAGTSVDEADGTSAGADDADAASDDGNSGDCSLRPHGAGRTSMPWMFAALFALTTRRRRR